MLFKEKFDLCMCLISHMVLTSVAHDVVIQHKADEDMQVETTS